jgi:polyisoprenoid-binding protein YceI
VTVDGAARPRAQATPAPGSWVADEAATTASFTVRNFGVREVRGTVAVTGARVTVDRAGRPVHVQATADLATLATGSTRRDADLSGGRFFDVLHHPELPLVARRVEPAGDGWRVDATVGVRGVQAPLILDVHLEPTSAEPGAPCRVVATGTLDLRSTPIRAPRALVGRWVAVRIDAVLKHSGDAAPATSS